MTGRVFSVAAIVVIFVLAAIEATAQPGFGPDILAYLTR